VTEPDGRAKNAVEAWLAEHAPAYSPPFGWTLVGGGRSNLTYRLQDSAGQLLVLRRPPAHIDAPGAHDVAREYRVQRALRDGSPICVPGPIAFCPDLSILGAPFYVMQYVDGTIVRDRAGAESLDETARAAASRAVVTQLAELHQVPAESVGLSDFGRPDGYLVRQLRRWSAQIRGGGPAETTLARAAGLLARDMPPQRSSALLHGDYRLDNLVLSGQGQVRAVLDWELSTQGDPLTDLGWLLLYWRPSPDLAAMLPGGSELSGFLDRDELARLYAASTGADLSYLPYYLALAAWRLAIITLGVQARYRSGASAGEQLDADQLSGQVDALAAAAMQNLGASA